jgi:hypothetical protein
MSLNCTEGQGLEAAWADAIKVLTQATETLKHSREIVTANHYAAALTACDNAREVASVARNKYMSHIAEHRCGMW